MRGLVLAALWLCACSSSEASPTAKSNPGGVKNVVVTHPVPGCTVTTEDAVDASVRNHIPVCSAVTYPHNPPMAGPHYPIWADFKIYDAPIPWGFLVHDLEHGAVVLVYNSADPAIVAGLQELYNTYPDDALCTAVGGRMRMVVVPDPDLDVPVAASAWGSHYKATCLDATSLRAFADAHYARAPEDECAAGADLSASGWCP